jgi:hypothetical protein
MMLLNGISSVTLSPILNSSLVNIFSSCIAELYTAGCEVSLLEGEKKTLK